MRTKLITIGNSMGVRLPKTLIQQFGLAGGDIDLQVEERGILITPVNKARHEWEKQFADAIKKDGNPKEDLIEGGNEFDKNEWTW